MRRLLASPTLNTEAQTQRARMFHTVAWSTLAVSNTLLALLIVVQPATWRRAIGAIVVIDLLTVALLGLSQRGRTRLASQLLVGGLVALVTSQAINAGGIQSPGVSAYFVFVLMAGLLLGERAAIILAGICVGLGLALVIAQSKGLLGDAVQYSGAARLLLSSVYMGVVVFLMRLATRELRGALARAESELSERRKAEQQLVLALDAGTIGVWEQDFQRNDFRGDERAFRLFGLTPPTDLRLPFDTWKRLIDAEDWPRVEATLRSLASGAERASVEYRINRPDGQTRYIAAAGASMFLGADMTMNAGVVVDITDRKNAELERERLLWSLGERVKELRLVHSAAGLLDGSRPIDRALLADMVIRIPEAWQFPECCEARIIYGDFDVTTPRWRESPWKQSVSFTTSAGAGRVEVVYLERRPESAEGPFLAEERSLLDSIADMLSNAIDRGIAEQSRQRSEERLRLALAGAQMAVWELDLETGEFSLSDEFEQMSGIAPSAFPRTSQAFWTLMHPDDAAAARVTMQRAIEDPSRGDLFATEFRLLRPGGGTRWLANSGRLMREGRKAPRVLGVVHDITGLRELQQQFQQSQKMDALGRLAGGVAHDFNNLLTAIKGYSYFLLESLPVDSANRRDVKEISDAADRASALTRQLLAFSRKQVLAPRLIDPNTVVLGMELLLKRLLGASVQLRVATGTELGAVRVDPGQLEQVIMNLAVNARDAMPTGGTLTIQTSGVAFDENVVEQRMSLKAGRYVMLAVSDTGEGMTPEVQARIFEPFFTTKEQGSGTGLGLATVFGIVQQSGGALWVYSEVGHGSTFKVYLPWASGAAEVESVVPVAADSLRGDERIVLADDDNQVRALADRALRGHGYRVSSFASGDEALTFIRKAPSAIDLLVTDVVMPKLSGPDLASLVRRANPDVRVLYLTGYTDRPIDQESGAGVLHKPFTPQTLLQAVRSVLDRQPVRSDLA